MRDDPSRAPSERRNLPVERIPDEVSDKLDLVATLFASARSEETETE